VIVGVVSVLIALAVGCWIGLFLARDRLADAHRLHERAASHLAKAGVALERARQARERGAA
jgi:hypothetical protein